MDGRRGDSAWEEADVIATLVQREPLEGRPVSERTEVRLVYDDEALYVGAWLFDSRPDQLVVGQTLRDASLSDSDAFLLILDTYLDRQNGVVFGTTPAGIEYDGQVAGEAQGGGRGGGRQQSGSGGGFNLNWDGGWEVATSQDGDGWYAEMRIPFSTLRYPGAGPQEWGLNFERRIRRKNELAVWAPLPRQFEIHRVSMAGTLELEAPARRVMTVSPYVLSEALRDYRVEDRDVQLDGRIGGDAKLGLTQRLTLDLTVNTDFAQAEVDDQQVNLTRFSLFFPEKRGFFLENAGTFAVGSSRSSELFFSRRIGLAENREVPIQAGGRLTGRVGDVQIGLLNIQTEGARFATPDPDAGPLVVPSNNFGVIRVFREGESRSRLGGIAVSRVNTDDPGDRNVTLGLDGRLGFGQSLTLDGWMGVTSTRTPDEAAIDRAGFGDGAYGFSGSGSYVTRNWQITSEYREIGDHFNPEVGFLNRRGYRHGRARVLRHLRTPSVSWFREFRPHVSWSQFWSLGGFTESYLVHIDSHFAFENGAFFQLPGFNFTGEGLQQPFEIRPGIVIPEGTYHNVDWEFRANTDRSAPLSLSAGWDLGGFYSGTRFGPTGTLAYRSGDRLTTSLQVSWFDVRLEEGEFTTAVARLNTSYSFTPSIYLQSSIQYNDDTEDLSANVRLGWLESGGAGLFIVLNDSEHFGSLARTGFTSGPNQRQLIIKYSRLLDFSR